jgi:hypothetical protein
MNGPNRELRRIQLADRRAVRRVLSRAYPLAKQLAEILELEAVEPQATRAKKLRQEIGALLAVDGESAEFE